jgi:hypothetical protein
MAVTVTSPLYANMKIPEDTREALCCKEVAGGYRQGTNLLSVTGTAQTVYVNV